MDDQQLHTNIESLVAEEHRLLDKGSALTADDRRRLDDVNVALDRLWDLLRQRRRVKSSVKIRTKRKNVRPKSSKRISSKTRQLSRL